jgi:hypothetical protein
VTTTTYRYRAQTDPTIQTWHLGAEERGAASFCGVRLIEPGDTRAFALRVPADRRHMTTDADVSKVTCGACKRNREWAKATAAEPEPERAGRPSRRRARTATPEAGAGLSEHTAAQLLVDGVQARARRRKATGDPRADRAAADVAAAADAAAVTPERRRAKSRATRAHERQEADRARREAAG